MAKSMSVLSSVGLLLGCSTLFSAPAGPPAAGPSRIELPGRCRASAGAAHVVLVAIDGVRPREIFLGSDPERATEARSAERLTPHLHALADRGVALGRPGLGARVSASGPSFVSLPGYTEMLTGRPAACQSNDCEHASTPTLVDAFVRAASGACVGVFSSWEAIGRLTRDVPGHVLVSTGRHHARGFDGASRGAREALALGDAAPPEPGSGDYRPDAATIALAEAYLEAVAPSFLFVSLGDTDERAHQGDYEGYLAALARADAFVGSVAARADAWRAAGERTVVIVTTDHGRAADFVDHGGDYPESADVWVVAAGSGIPAGGDVALASPAYLYDVGRTVAGLAKIALQAEPSGRDLVAEVTETIASRQGLRTAALGQLAPSRGDDALP